MNIKPTETLESWDKPLCWVDADEKAAFHAELEHRFVHHNSSRYLVKKSTGQYAVFDAAGEPQLSYHPYPAHVRNIAAPPKLVPWTYDTCPWPRCGIMLLRDKGSRRIVLVHVKDIDSINYQTFATTAASRECSIDNGVTWHPCSTEE